MAAKKPRKDLTSGQVREALDYDPETGTFTWKRRADMTSQWNGHYAGKVAGCISRSSPRNHYRVIGLGGAHYFAHRLAWLHYYGEWPEDQIDHINSDGLDNRIANLRESTQLQNMGNRRPRHDSATGIKGVSCTKEGKFRADIKRGGKIRNLGTFDTAEEAGKAYAKAARLKWGEFART